MMREEAAYLTRNYFIWSLIVEWGPFCTAFQILCISQVESSLVYSAKMFPRSTGAPSWQSTRAVGPVLLLLTISDNFDRLILLLQNEIFIVEWHMEKELNLFNFKLLFFEFFFFFFPKCPSCWQVSLIVVMQKEDNLLLFKYNVNIKKAEKRTGITHKD